MTNLSIRTPNKRQLILLFFLANLTNAAPADFTLRQSIQTSVGVLTEGGPSNNPHEGLSQTEATDYLRPLAKKKNRETCESLLDKDAELKFIKVPASSIPTSNKQGRGFSYTLLSTCSLGFIDEAAAARRLLTALSSPAKQEAESGLLGLKDTKAVHDVILSLYPVLTEASLIALTGFADQLKFEPELLPDVRSKFVKTNRIEEKALLEAILATYQEKAEVALTSLLVDIESEKEPIRTIASEVLVAIGKNSVAPLVELLERKPSKEVRGSILLTMIGLVERNPNLEYSLPVLEFLADQKWPGTTELLANQISGHYGAKAKKFLPQMVDLYRLFSKKGKGEGEPYEMMKSAVIKAIGSMGPDAESAVDFLIEVTKESWPGYQAAAAASLGQIGSKARAALPTLKALLPTIATSYRPIVQKAIEQIEGK